MNDWQSIQKIKRQAIARIKRKIRPHLWECGYIDHNTERGEMIFAFEPKRLTTEDGHRKPTDCRRIPKAIDSDLRTGFQGFYHSGTFDAYGHGMGLCPFESLAAEDILWLERWLEKNWEKEVQLHLTNNAASARV